MSVGGVNPIEWVLPPLALTHLAVDAASKVATGENALNVPGSAGAKQKQAEAEQQQRLSASQELAAEQKRKEEANRPLTASQEQDSRARLSSATEFITGRKRQILG